MAPRGGERTWKWGEGPDDLEALGIGFGMACRVSSDHIGKALSKMNNPKAHLSNALNDMEFGMELVYAMLGTGVKFVENDGTDCGIDTMLAKHFVANLPIERVDGTGVLNKNNTNIAVVNELINSYKRYMMLAYNDWKRKEII